MNSENDKQKDKRFSQLLSAADRNTAGPDKEFLDNLKEQSTAEFLASTANGTKHTKIKTPFPIWRIIIKSNIIKFAAAAVIIIVAILLLHNGSVSITTPAFGLEDVYNAIDNLQWIHSTMTIVEMSDKETGKKVGDVVLDWWRSANPYILISKYSDGEIYFVKENNNIKIHFMYDPKINIITIRKTEFTEQIHSSLSDMMKAELLRAKNTYQKIEYEKSIFEGQPVMIITLKHTPEDENSEYSHDIVSLIVDPGTYLPKKVEIQEIYPKKNSTVKMSGTFVYPESGPTDIYEAGAPRDAKVIDETQKENQ